MFKFWSKLATALVFVFLSSGYINSSYAVEPLHTLADIPTLAAESQQMTASKRIAAYFTRYHYGRTELTAELGQQVYDRYLEQLDYNRMFMLQSDLDRFNVYRDSFHEFLIKGELTVAFDIYQLQLQRRYERYNYALTLLDSEFTFDLEGERYYYDRSKGNWATSKDELNQAWAQRVRNDALNLALAGRTEDEIKENLARRYQTALQRLTQSQNEDAFQALMNAFGRSVDAHTSYLSPRNAERFRQNMNLSLEGIGALLQAEYDYTVISSLVPGGPAERSGQLAPNDRIIAVAQGDQDFVDVIGWRLDDVVELITGPKGSVVRLQVLPESQGTAGTPKTVEITRAKIRLEDREAKLELKQIDEQNIGIIEIPNFYNDLSNDVRNLLATLAEKETKGLIIDLRGNGGGSLDEAIHLSGLFIPSGPVVQVRDSSGRVNVSDDPDPNLMYDGPLVVLVDRFSASASEIFAAAMQDYGRALVVGEQTFGKGTVQQHRGLQRRFDFYSSPMGSVQYTIAKFYRINGGSTQHKGVMPDIPYPTAIDPAEFGESKAENALPWDQIDPVAYIRMGQLSAEQLQALMVEHDKRIAASHEFAYVFEDIERFKELQNRDYVSLVRSEREAESEANKARRLNRANERLQRAGLDVVETWDDVPDDYQDADPYLDETLQITRDYITLLKSKK